MSETSNNTQASKFHYSDILFFLSLVFALWFAVTGMAWGYLANLFIALPAGLISLLLWFIGKRNTPRPKRFKAIPIILMIGVALSLGVFIYLMITN